MFISICYGTNIRLRSFVCIKQNVNYIDTFSDRCVPSARNNQSSQYIVPSHTVPCFGVSAAFVCQKLLILTQGTSGRRYDEDYLKFLYSSLLFTRSCTGTLVIAKANNNN
jgi:hypothetical protein